MKIYKTTPLTASFHRAMVINLMSLPPSKRFLGRTEPQCDFCADPKPTTLYAASRLTDGKLQDCWRWSACAGCHAAITANDYNKLYDRAALVFGGTDQAKVVVRAVLIAFHADAISM